MRKVERAGGRQAGRKEEERRANSTNKKYRRHSPRRVRCHCHITCTHEGGGVKTETLGARSMQSKEVISQACAVDKPETAPQGTETRPCLLLVPVSFWSSSRVLLNADELLNPKPYTLKPKY